MPYADYDYYLTTYKGNLPEEEFNCLSRQASAYLDRVTFGRITDEWTAKEAVKDACCAVSEKLHQEESPVLTSQTVGSWSQTYATDQSTRETRLYRIAELYLGNTGLMYRGVEPCSRTL